MSQRKGIQGRKENGKIVMTLPNGQKVTPKDLLEMKRRNERGHLADFMNGYERVVVEKEVKKPEPVAVKKKKPVKEKKVQWSTIDRTEIGAAFKKEEPTRLQKFLKQFKKGGKR